MSLRNPDIINGWATEDTVRCACCREEYVYLQDVKNGVLGTQRYREVFLKDAKCRWCQAKIQTCCVDQCWDCDPERCLDCIKFQRSCDNHRRYVETDADGFVIERSRI